MYGIKSSTLTLGDRYRIHIPKIKLSSNPGVPAYMRVSLMEETPGMLNYYVESYRWENIIFTTQATAGNFINLVNAANKPHVSEINSQTQYDWTFTTTISDPIITIYDVLGQ
jgi:hypothetical protein